MKILIIGKGLVGGRCAELWADAEVAEGYVRTTAEALALLDKHRPDAVLNAAGIVGKPNVDWCEDHALATMVGNTMLPLMIAEACQERNVYLLHVGTGCVYYGYSTDSAGWKESDFPNPSAVYTRTKYAADLALSVLPNVGVGRIRMPIDSVPSRANLIDKLAAYPQVVDVVNSATIMEDMAVVFHQLLEKKATGIFHVTNPGALRHREILELYKKYVDPNHHNEWITDVQLVDRGLAKKKRSNTLLQSENLARYGIFMPEIHESLEMTIKKYAELKKVR